MLCYSESWNAKKAMIYLYIHFTLEDRAPVKSPDSGGWILPSHYVERLSVKLTVRYLADSGFNRAILVSIARK